MVQAAQLTSYMNDVTSSTDKRQRTTVKGLLDRLDARTEVLRSDVIIKKDHFEDVDRMWQGFTDR